MKNLTWQNPEQLFVAQVLINKVKSKCCGIKDTDNYLTNEVQSIDKPELIKDIFELSLSVEKDLFDNLYKLNS